MNDEPALFSDPGGSIGEVFIRYIVTYSPMGAADLVLSGQGYTIVIEDDGTEHLIGFDGRRQRVLRAET